MITFQKVSSKILCLGASFSVDLKSPQCVNKKMAKKSIKKKSCGPFKQ